MANKKNLSFFLPGAPRPQLRARARRLGNRVIIYDPQSKEKKAESLKIKELWDHPVLVGPISVSVTFYMKMPSWARRKDINLIGWGITQHTAKPDVDNLAKKILDECNGIVWADDRQIVTLHIHKEYSDNPRLEMEIKDVDTTELDDVGAEILGLFSEDRFISLIDIIKEYALASQTPGISRVESLYCSAKAISKMADICGKDLIEIRKRKLNYHKKTFEEVISDQLAKEAE